MHVREEALLEARKSSLQNPDDWPTFHISNICVTSQNTGKKVSLLSAHVNNAVCVSGKLEEIEDGFLNLVRDKNYRDKAIEISNVMTYAFAEYNDGTYGFWAAGKAGWFEIQSASNAYHDTYEKMIQAASMFYMLADKLKRSRNRNPKISRKRTDQYADQIFQDYLGQGRHSTLLGEVDDVREAFHEHRAFLITSMLEDQEGLNWSGTPMFNYLKWRFPDDFSSAEARIRGKGPPTLLCAEVMSDRPEKRKSQTPEDADNNPSKKRKRGRPRSSEMNKPQTPVSSSVADISSSGDDKGVNPTNVIRKRRSILQPSGGKYSKKATGRRNRPPVVISTKNSEDGSDEGMATNESPITTIRTAKDLEFLTDPPENRLSPDLDDSPGPRYLPRKYLELKVVQYDLPSTEPQGPGHLWMCTFEGCFHRVHEASTDDGKKRIKDHYKSHSTQAQEKIDLVLDESRPYLPVNNLVRRLQAFASGADAELASDSLERKFSAPLKRRF